MTLKRKLVSAIQWCASFPRVFFPSDQRGKRLFVLSSDGASVKIDIQLIKLQLLSSNSNSASPASRADASACFHMQRVLQMTNWHARLTASAYEPQSQILVVCGGCKTPVRSSRNVRRPL